MKVKHDRDNSIEKNLTVYKSYKEKPINSLLTYENARWLDYFCSLYGRPLRVLHISNVANNAYNNAKLLNNCNIINHVIAPNDKYAMGCPEWEDADFSDDIVDLWNPRWSEISLNGFERPNWFIQGDFDYCYRQLQSLLKEKRVSIKGDETLRSSKFSLLIYRLWIKNFYSNFLFHVRQLIKAFIKKVDLIFGFNFYLRISITYYKIKSFRNHLINLYEKKVDFQKKPNLQFEGTQDGFNNFRGYGEWKVDQALISSFSKEFPERLDKLLVSDFIPYYYSRTLMAKLIDNYDLVIGYAAEGIYPLMCSKPYIAFEHGTIRDIPYKSNSEGRLCSLTYRLSNHVFVTNFDCKKSAEFLNPKRYSIINHPFDENHADDVIDFDDIRSSLKNELDADFLFFFPTRHDWVEGTGYADKGNDIFLRAFCRLRDSGYRVGLVCCQWGKNISESKELLLELNAAKFVKWVKPLPVKRFERMSKSVDLVVDQFKLGSFGGVMFKAMAAGSPVLSFLDIERIKDQYEIPPPVVNCKNEDEIYYNVKGLIASPNILNELKKESREWIIKFHGKKKLINEEVEVFRKLIHFTKLHH